MKKPFIDLHKKYPKKEIALEAIARVNYIPFETDSDCLLSGWLPDYISKQYIFMTAVEMEYDFRTDKGLKKTHYGLDKKTGIIYRTHVYNRDYPEDPDYYCMPYQLVNGYLVQYYTAEQLLDALGSNQLSGLLKEITSALNEEDNGVLMMIDFI